MSVSPTRIATRNLVRRSVRDLLERSPVFSALPARKREQIARDTARVAAYLADADGATRKQALRASFAVDGAAPLAGLINAVDFPNFVRGLIDGVFDAIVAASIEQMQAYADLMKEMAETVDQFAKDYADEARAFLLDGWPDCCTYDKKAKQVRIAADCLRSRIFLASLDAELSNDLKGRATAARILSAVRTHVTVRRQRQALRSVSQGINRIVVTRTPIVVGLTPVTLPSAIPTEEPPAKPASIESVDCGVAGFVGLVDRATTEPVSVDSYAAFETQFGESDGASLAGQLAMAVRGFFENGGRRLYIAGVPSADGGAMPSDEDWLEGVTALAGIDEIGILAAPGITSAVVQQALIDQCERRRDRIALLDSTLNASLDEVTAQREPFDSSYAALYYPWLQVRDALSGELVLAPPSGHLAGWYAARALAPAIADPAVQGAEGLEMILKSADVERLAGASVNPLRVVAGRGAILWSGHTLGRDPEWKYVNVRRLALFIERSIDAGLQWAVFEPNNDRLWSAVRASIADFLMNQWRTGTLAGNRPEQAFFVRCDRSTMTQEDIDNGRLVVVIGVAPVRPSEYVIIRIQCLTGDCH